MRSSNWIFMGLGAALIIVLLFVFKKPVIRTLGGYTELKKETVIDTTYLPIEIDTLEIFNHYVETKGIILNPEPIIKYVKVEKDDIQIIDSTKTYNVAVNDSLINGTMRVVNDFQGNLLDANFRYKPLFPKTIVKTKPILVEKTITETVYNTNERFGVGIGINSQQTPSISFEYINSKNWGLELEGSKPDLIDKDYPIKDVVIGLKLKKFF